MVGDVWATQLRGREGVSFWVIIVGRQPEGRDTMATTGARRVSKRGACKGQKIDAPD